MARQKHLEKSAYDVALERLQQQADMLDALGVHNPALNKSTLQTWMWEWHVKLRKRIEEEIKTINEAERKVIARRNLGPGGSSEALTPYFTLVKAERLSLITILEIMRLQGSSGLSDGMKTTRALISVGKAVEMEYKAQMCKKHQVYAPKDPPLQQQVQQSQATGRIAGSTAVGGDLYSQLGYKSLRERRIAVAKEVEGEEWSLGWSQTTRSKIGGILVDCLMEVAEVERTAKDKNTGETMYVLFPSSTWNFD